jgi:hypothetical protein
MYFCMSTCITSHLIGLQVGCSGTIVGTFYHIVYGEFPCCLVGGRLDPVGAVVCFVTKNNITCYIVIFKIWIHIKKQARHLSTKNRLYDD